MIKILSLFIAVLLSTSVVSQSNTPTLPPVEKGNFKKSELVELTQLDPTFKLDIRYATSNNFVGKPVYKEAKAFLQKTCCNSFGSST